MSTMSTLSVHRLIDKTPRADRGGAFCLAQSRATKAVSPFAVKLARPLH
jgi:hypothetical protein